MENKLFRVVHQLKKQHGRSTNIFHDLAQNDEQIRQALHEFYSCLCPPDEAKDQLLKLAGRISAIESAYAKPYVR